MGKILFFALVVRPLVLVILGLNVRNRHRLPKEGPALLVANHNSHLDTLVLMSLFPLRALPRIRPVAAADYFLSSRLLSWFSRTIIGIIPLHRKGREALHDLDEGVGAALQRGEIVILFPEGTRGEPERAARLRGGVARVVEARPDVPVHPVLLHGPGKALPRGEGLLVPFFCDVFVGELQLWPGTRHDFMAALERSFESLAGEARFPEWS